MQVPSVCGLSAKINMCIVSQEFVLVVDPSYLFGMSQPPLVTAVAILFLPPTVWLEILAEINLAVGFL